MPKEWLQEKIRNKERVEKKTTEASDQEFVTIHDAAARLGITVKTLYEWIATGIVPTPRKYRTSSKRPFRSSYVERLRALIIIRNSTVGMNSLKAFGNMCRKQLLGLR